MLGFVLRNCKVFQNYKTKLVLYNSLIRSVLEYCSVVWRPHYAVHSLRLERIQKRFLWHLAFSDGISRSIYSYKHRLMHYHIKSLENRRKIHDAIFVCKILNHRIDCPPLLSLFKFRVPSRLPRHPITPLCPPFRRTVLGGNSPYARFCREVNS